MDGKALMCPPAPPDSNPLTCFPNRLPILVLQPSGLYSSLNTQASATPRAFAEIVAEVLKAGPSP